LLKGQADGFGAVLSFDVGDVAIAKKIMEKVKLPAVAVSLGAVESILSYPAKMSHAAIPALVRYEMGISDSLLRLSVGLEDPEDILQDILRAID
jgi:cystathionine beta-lyase/cystathionine gamma-synthase